MKSFYRWLGSKIQESFITNSTKETQPYNTLSSSKESLYGSRPVGVPDEINTKPITFKMFKAIGGWAIEFKQYDEKYDRTSTSLYVVTSEEELGKHISQIITMEALKQ